MGRKVFVSYSHRLDQTVADDFRSIFSDERDAFIDKSIREDIGELGNETIKSRLSTLIRDASVTVVLIGQDTGGRSWIDWEIYNSLRQGFQNERNGLLGVRIPYKQQWIPQRLLDNTPEMGNIIDWPSNYRTLANEIENAYDCRWGTPDLSAPLRQRNSYR
ncbi:MAG: TIR domain-containing protein [Deltaproteobacteria bacterium]|nr:TIR domain-containing protein [Deltaproteobacteria bacterium]